MKCAVEDCLKEGVITSYHRGNISLCRKHYENHGDLNWGIRITDKQKENKK
jgi:hypothetical protein